jgi:hypothetical protein
MAGGGLPLPATFRAVLHELLDNGPKTDRVMRNVIQDSMSIKESRVLAIWAGHGGWDGFARDILDQLKSKKLIEYIFYDAHDRKYWSLTSDFQPGTLYEVLPHMKIKVITSVQREERDELAKARATISRLAARLDQKRLLSPDAKENFEKLYDLLDWEDADDKAIVSAPKRSHHRQDDSHHRQDDNAVVTWEGIKPNRVPAGMAKDFTLRDLHDHRDQSFTTREGWERAKAAGIDVKGNGTIDASWRAGIEQGLIARSGHKPNIRYQWVAGEKTEEELAEIIRTLKRSRPDKERARQERERERRQSRQQQEPEAGIIQSLVIDE